MTRAEQTVFRNLQVSMPTLLDRDGNGYPVEQRFGISTFPPLFLVEPDGTISIASSGFVKRDLRGLGQNGPASNRFARRKRSLNGRAVEAPKIELPVEAR